ncbi:hypothetical protein CALCODRAFT_509351 [Calocera cornea HHB12733]|uniref:Uncharacterized protein n=1 Tax=Calocera cornea HHB12733 TaxID=1353952 RepID=A0A165FCZ3_9BASI|nr:hypothetical protein CALCODRAFT_509351 [Calocera cornea HHB12733]
MGLNPMLGLNLQAEVKSVAEANTGMEANVSMEAHWMTGADSMAEANTLSETKSPAELTGFRKHRIIWQAEARMLKPGAEGNAETKNVVKAKHKWSYLHLSVSVITGEAKS